MKRQQRVVWSKGMLLQPQHFQAQEQFFEDEISLQSLLRGPEIWGVSELSVDEQALQVGTFRLKTCTGVFSDGFVFSIPDGDPIPPDRSIDFQSGKLDVLLAVPLRQPRQPSISWPRLQGDGATAEGPTLRFEAEEQTYYNYCDGDEERIEVARPNFRVILSGESASGLATLPIARIARKEGIYRLDPEYIPPCLNAACSAYLWQNLQSLWDRLNLISVQLISERSEQSELLADFTETDNERFWVLDLVNRALPELRHLIRVRRAFPEDLYRFLARLFGGLCTFSTKQRPTELPEYDHYNLGRSLIELTTLVYGMLGDITFRRRKCRTVDLQVIDEGHHWRVQFEPEHLGEGKIYLALRAKQAELTVTEIESGSGIKVCGPVTIRDVKGKKLAGLLLKHELQAPTECPRQIGYIYFRVSPAWAPPPSDVAQTDARSRISPAGRQQGDRDVDIAQWRTAVWADVRHNGEMRIIVEEGFPEADIKMFVVMP